MLARSALPVLLALSGAGSPAAEFEVPSAELEDHVRSATEAAGIPGCAIAVFDTGGVRYSGAFGVASADGKPVTERTPFVIGSISKALTAYAILTLADQGKLDLREPASRHVSWIHPKITISDLLRHTSGYSGRDGVDFDRRFAHSTLGHLVSTYEDLELNRPVGSSFEYSNVNYNLLGAIVERVTGTSFAAHIRQTVFEELGMTCSFTDLPAARAAGLSDGHRLLFRRPIPAGSLPFFDSFLPSMTMASCSTDLAAFLSAILARSSVSATPYASFGERYSEATLDGYQGFYDYGFLATELAGERTYFFQGGYRSFRSYAFLFPDKGFGVLGLMNVNTMFSDGELRSLVANAARLVLGRPLQKPEPDRTYAVLLTILILVALLQLGRATRYLRLRNTGVLAWPSIAFDTGVLVLFTWVIPRLWSIHLNTMVFIQPDLAYLMFGIIAFTAAMLSIRLSVLLLRFLRRRGVAA